MLLVIHHIIADFWSTAVLVDDLGKAYADQSRVDRVTSRAAVADTPTSRAGGPRW